MKKISKEHLSDDKKLLEEVIKAKKYNIDPEMCNKIILEKKIDEIKSHYDSFNFEYNAITVKDKKTHEAFLSLYNNGVKKLKDEIIKIKGKSHSSYCLYCRLEVAWEIDHYYPKAEYSEFSIYLGNLFPVCHRCNLLKGEKVHRSGEKRNFLYFYEDDISEDFLYVELTYEGGGDIPKIRYNFRDDTPNVLKNHILNLDLLKRNEERAISEVNMVYKSMSRSYKSGIYSEINSIKKELEIFYEELKKDYGHNDWQAVLYKELAGNDNFLNTVIS